MAVFPVPGWPAISTARPAIFPSYMYYSNNGKFVYHVSSSADVLLTHNIPSPSPGWSLLLFLQLPALPSPGTPAHIRYVHSTRGKRINAIKGQFPNYVYQQFMSIHITLRTNIHHIITHISHYYTPQSLLTGRGSNASSKPRPRIWEWAPIGGRQLPWQQNITQLVHSPILSMRVMSRISWTWDTALWEREERGPGRDATNQWPSHLKFIVHRFARCLCSDYWHWNSCIIAR